MGAYRAAGFFVLRAPLLAADTLRRWGEAGVPAEGEDPLVARERARSLLREVIERPEVREAIYVASPSLSERLGKWIADPETKAGAKVEAALVRYFARMCSRPTPYGLFAGFSVGEIAARTELVLGGACFTAGLQRNIRLDSQLLN